MTTASATQLSAPGNGVLSARLAQVKKSLVRRLSHDFSDRLPVALIRRAIDEAEELAHSTGFPHLVLPLLAEETVRRVSLMAFADESAREPILALAC
jgi:hypothetical protein